ncbi:MAG TPA: hypothetical protein PLB52_02320 [Candidatus Moranbacteria bacterium]|mgnify:CR=1 FL=1|nr:hypothetical protein [Candidatus Moranbacteria bacterium]
MKNFFVIYDGDDWNVEVPMNYEMTRRAFEKWNVMALEKNVAMFRACVDWYNAEKNVFQKAWAYRDGKWQKIEKEIIPDLIYDKTSGDKQYDLFGVKSIMHTKSKVFNDPLFRIMLNNKLTQYVLFSEYMPISFLATTKKELADVLEKIPSAKAVVKPLQGSGGFGIIIDAKKVILKSNSLIIYPVLVQEFIEGGGIPNFSEGEALADLRIVFMHHKPKYALSRVAKKGSLFTNMHQGAEGVRVPLEKIPESINEMLKNIVEKLNIFPKAQYSLDFFFSKEKKPYLIEMNTTPGVCLIEAMGDDKLQEESLDDILALL